MKDPLAQRGAPIQDTLTASITSACQQVTASNTACCISCSTPHPPLTQYDGDTKRATDVLAGFFWWQGERDSLDMALAGRYEVNLVKLIKTLRVQYKAPNAKFVTATLGQTVQGATDGGGLILHAMEAVDGKSGKYPEFKDNVASVYTYSHPYSMGSSSGSHYDGNAETYMNIGQAMGAAMVGLFKAGK